MLFFEPLPSDALLTPGGVRRALTFYVGPVDGNLTATFMRGSKRRVDFSSVAVVENIIFPATRRGYGILAVSTHAL